LDKKTINIVWFKRDFRIIDNEALFYAQQSEIPLLLICFFEPSIMNYPDSDARHWRFIYQSIADLNKKLEPFNSKIYFFHDEVKTVFLELIKASLYFKSCIIFYYTYRFKKVLNPHLIP
jgi:deoxyribodipyrimidine photo-lyase